MVAKGYQTVFERLTVFKPPAVPGVSDFKRTLFVTTQVRQLNRDVLAGSLV